MNRYTCAFAPSTACYEYDEDEVCDFVSDETADKIRELDVGETLVDEDGDTWERIA